MSEVEDTMCMHYVRDRLNGLVTQSDLLGFIDEIDHGLRVNEEWRQANPPTLPEQVSVDPEDFDVQTAIDNFGTVDAVVNNAGILRDKSFAKMEEEDLNAIIDVHLKGTFFVCQPAFIQMKEQGYGRFVNVSSPSGLFGNFGQLNYGAAKMGIVGLTNVLAIEGAKYNIKANVIAPNAATRMTEELFGEDMSKLLTVDNITPLVVYLASEQCEVTHEIFSAGGGRFARIGISTDVGYFNASAKAEDIFANIGEIRDLSNPIYPTSLADELPLFNEAMNKGN